MPVPGAAGRGGDNGSATAAVLSDPLGLALDAKNDVYIADRGNSRVAFVPSSTTTLTLPPVDTGKTSSQILTVLNFGNAPLTLSGLALSSHYSQAPSGGTDCTPTMTLAPGAACLIDVVFAPVLDGSVNGSLTLTDNALNAAGATQIITLVGTGHVPSIATSISVTSGDGQSAAPYSTFSLPLQVTVLDQNGNTDSGVSVVFTVTGTGATGSFSNGSNTITATTNLNGVASVSLAAGASDGALQVKASVSGVANAASFSETIAGKPSPSITLSDSPATSPAAYGETLVLTATVTAPPGAVASVGGSVTFADGATSLGTPNVSNGVASFTYTPQAGSHSYTATFNGDTNYSSTGSSTAKNLTITPLPVTVSANPVTFVLGTTPLPTLTGKVTGVLPADATNVTLALSTNPAYSAALAAGNYPISASLSGSAAADYRVVSTTGTVTVTAAPASVSLSASNTVPGTATPVTLMASVVSLVNGAALNATVPSANISFYDGGILLGSAITGQAGNATLKYTFTTLGTHTITAVAVPGNYGPATSNTVTILVSNPGLSLSTDAPSYTVVQGQKADVALTTIAPGGVATTITYACGGLPANTSCIFTPANFTPTPNASPAVPSVTIDMQLDTAGPGPLLTSSPATHRPGARGREWISFAGALTLPGFALLAFAGRPPPFEIRPAGHSARRLWNSRLQRLRRKHVLRAGPLGLHTHRNIHRHGSQRRPAPL